MFENGGSMNYITTLLINCLKNKAKQTQRPRGDGGAVRRSRGDPETLETSPDLPPLLNWRNWLNRFLKGLTFDNQL